MGTRYDLRCLEATMKDFNADLMIGCDCFHGCCGSDDHHVLRWADFALLADQGVGHAEAITKPLYGPYNYPDCDGDGMYECSARRDDNAEDGEIVEAAADSEVVPSFYLHYYPFAQARPWQT